MVAMGMAVTSRAEASGGAVTLTSGFGSGQTPWLATQRVAWAAVRRP